METIGLFSGVLLFSVLRLLPKVRTQEWHSSESTRLPLLWPGFNSWTWRHMWVEFVVGSRPCSKVFSLGFLVSIPPQIPTLQIPI